MSRPFVLGDGWFWAQLFINHLFLNVLTYLQDEKNKQQAVKSGRNIDILRKKIFQVDLAVKID